MVFDFFLLVGKLWVSFERENPMLLFKIVIILKESGDVSRWFAQSLHLEIIQSLSLLKHNMLRVVQDRVECGNNATRIVETAVLLHVEIACRVHGTTLQIFSFLQKLKIANNTNDRLWNERKKFLIEAKKLLELPVLGHAEVVHVLGEDFGVALEGWPLENLRWVFVIYHTKILWILIRDSFVLSGLFDLINCFFVVLLIWHEVWWLGLGIWFILWSIVFGWLERRFANNGYIVAHSLLEPHAGAAFRILLSLSSQKHSRSVQKNLLVIFERIWLQNLV